MTVRFRELPGDGHAAGDAEQAGDARRENQKVPGGENSVCLRVSPAPRGRRSPSADEAGSCLFATYAWVVYTQLAHIFSFYIVFGLAFVQ